ncbi:acyl-CoA dehydrogenase family protein [Pseudonocardia spinosispora]|uniref:acyl-CoA dehydrogenase family protein n=1 Tax=Pseudonocardia spinosispora TaxID=103441 RepID=UPI0003F80FB9|nr:acyl-CoA dehydrogenase family protein [Pseudonocardia spinosispora]
MRSPVEELFAAPPDVAGHPAVRAATRIGAELLEPHASAADDPRRGVDRAHLALLAEAGLYSVTVPADLGGHGADARVAAEVVELLAAACAATWFVTTQHELPSALARTSVADPAFAYGAACARYRDELSTGRTRAGIAIAHIRRPGRPTIRAERDGRGFRFSGRADWCTGWGLVDLVMIAAVTESGELVLALRPAAAQRGLRASAALPLAVMGGTRTVALELDELIIEPEDVLLVAPLARWLETDLWHTANTRPASLGLLRRALVELERIGDLRERPEARALARKLAAPAARLRARAYQLILEVPPAERLNERGRLRGELAELTVRATQALIAARAGSAMLLSSPEQRWAREASFHLIQAQTDSIRTAQLTAFGAP